MILRSSDIRSALRARQRGFLLNPFRFGNVVPLALDPYTTNLWGAYGLTQLRVGYGGSAVRVRKSTGGDTTTQQDIGFSAGALDTSALATFAGSESVVVTKFYDQSVNGNDFVQATTTKQPRIVNAGVYDGFIRFDGAAHYMTAASSPVTTALSIAMKYQLRSSGATHWYIGQSNTNSAAHNVMAVQAQTDGGNTIRFYNFTGATSFGECGFATLPTTQGVDMWIANRALSGTARQARYRNGSAATATSLSAGATGGSFTSETFYLGADNSGAAAFSPMNLNTLAIWSADQATDQAAIATALA